MRMQRNVLLLPGGGVHSMSKLDFYSIKLKMKMKIYQIKNENENLQYAFTQELDRMLYFKMLRATRDTN